MNYDWPYIDHLDQIREAIKGREEFIVAEREGFFVVNYLVNFEDTFPIPNTKDPKINLLYSLRRECRGLKFHKNGEIAARPFHKFFNLNERPETAEHKMDLSETFVILDKLDGSMVHPLVINNKFIMATKMGITDVANLALGFVDANRHIRYEQFCREHISAGYTPIFEWCSRKNRIVVDYPTDKLVLTAIRHNKTGMYHSYQEMLMALGDSGIPVVDAWDGDIEGLSHFVSMTSHLQDEEGYVLRFDNGHMIKIKNEWYCQLHKVKELLEFEKDVVALILNEGHDDAKAFMNDEDKDRIDRFAEELYNGIAKTADELNWIVIAAKDNLNNSRKRFAEEEIPKHSIQIKGLLFNIWGGDDPFNVVRNYILKNTGSSTKVENVRQLFGGIKWERY